MLTIALALIITFGDVRERNAALDVTPSTTPSERSMTTSEAATLESATPEAGPTEEAEGVLAA